MIKGTMSHFYQKCPDCTDTVQIDYHRNRWVEWFAGDCDCDYEFRLLGKDFQYVQPSSLFFETIYGFNPAKDEEKERKQKEIEAINRKVQLEEKYKKQENEGELKPWERKTIEDIVLKEKDF